MNLCDDIRAQMVFYLDDELRGAERVSFEAHLDGCACCRELIDRERQMLGHIRDARPLYTAPTELRARVDKILSHAPAPVSAPPSLRRRVRHALRQTTSVGPTRRSAALAALVVVVSLVGVWGLRGRGSRPAVNSPSEFALMAVGTHLRHLRGQLPLEIATPSPEQIREWFAGKVPFSLKLPNYQEVSGQEKLYRLEGARLVGFKNDYAAYVAYQMNRRPISLVVTSASVAVPHGGEEIASNGLTFHCDSIDGLKVITWSDHGLTYALVSDLEERGQQSCLVCHAGTKDRDFIEILKP